MCWSDYLELKRLRQIREVLGLVLEVPGQSGNSIGGRYGIRTHGDPEATTAFEAAPFVRSGNLPPFRIVSGVGGLPAHNLTL